MEKTADGITDKKSKCSVGMQLEETLDKYRKYGKTAFIRYKVTGEALMKNAQDRLDNHIENCSVCGRQKEE